MRVSVALCTYNGARYLEEQLASLAAQTRRPDEVVACDDCSSDATVAILQQFATTAPFPVRVTVQPRNVKSTLNFARAIELCSGDVIFLCDQDDVWHPDKLARFEAEFADPQVGLVASDLELIDGDGRLLGQRMWANIPFTPSQQAEVQNGNAALLWVRNNTITGAAAAFRADLRDVLLPIPSCWVHDGWIAFLGALVGRVRLLSEPLTRYRVHPGQQIGCEPLTLRRQIRAARRMDAAYFAKLAECFELLTERLDKLKDRLGSDALRQLTREKAQFSRARQRMREGGRLGRVFPAIGGLLQGHYHRHAQGLKAFAADLLL